MLVSEKEHTVGKGVTDGQSYKQTREGGEGDRKQSI